VRVTDALCDNNEAAVGAGQAETPDNKPTRC
jgi:hypothetical protein